MASAILNRLLWIDVNLRASAMMPSTLVEIVTSLHVTQLICGGGGGSYDCLVMAAIQWDLRFSCWRC
jgi:hypothetical protein